MTVELSELQFVSKHQPDKRFKFVLRDDDKQEEYDPNDFEEIRQKGCCNFKKKSSNRVMDEDCPLDGSMKRKLT